MSAPTRQTLYSCLQADLSPFGRADKNNPFSDWREVAVTSLLESVFKKFEDPNPGADAKAISKFVEINQNLRTFKLVALSSWDEEVVGSVKKLIDDFLHPAGQLLIPGYDSLFYEGAVGPGQSVRGRGGDFYTKMFSSELTTTSLELYKSYSKTVATLPSWWMAEISRFNTNGTPTVVEGNRLSVVPKNVDISRTICVEPTLNMWYQLGVGNLLSARLRQFFGIDLACQQGVNRELARLGSLDCSSTSLSTIDLESASDSISLEIIRSLFPQWFSDLLLDLRSPISRLPDGSTLQLEMVSTMGNGFTFPLQTLIFACVVSAVYSQLGISPERVDSHERPRKGNAPRWPNWAVNGDDIVVRSDAYNRVVHVLSLLGFRVNTLKSFSNGPFRESCGADFFKGRFVRGVYLKRLGSAQDVYVAFNKFVRWSASMSISLDTTLRYLLTKARFNPVPWWESDDAGFKVPKWFAGVPRRNSSGVYPYRAILTKTAPMVLTDDAIRVPRGLRKRDYNPNGLIVSITRGDWADGETAPRHRSGRTIPVRRVALNWDIPPASDLRGWLVGERHAFAQAKYASIQRDWPVGDAFEPIAGSDEGRRCDAVFYGLF